MSALPVSLIGTPGDDFDLNTPESYARSLLEALGVDLSAPGLASTPARMVQALREMTTPVPFEPTEFEAVGAPGQMVLVTGIPLVSVCEHHVLPFVGEAQIGYIPSGRILGLSKLARVVQYFGRRLQVQERMTYQIADWMLERLNPVGVGVLLRAEHTCMTLRGVGAQGSQTTTSALRGVLLDDPAARAEFMTLASRA